MAVNGTLNRWAGDVDEAGLQYSGGQKGFHLLIVKAETFRRSRNKETCPLMRTSAPSTALDKELRLSVCQWEESVVGWRSP